MNKTIKILLLLLVALCSIVAFITVITKYCKCPCCNKLKSFFGNDDYSVLPMDDRYEEV